MGIDSWTTHGGFRKLGGPFRDKGLDYTLVYVGRQQLLKIATCLGHKVWVAERFVNEGSTSSGGYPYQFIQKLLGLLEYLNQTP